MTPHRKRADMSISPAGLSVRRGCTCKYPRSSAPIMLRVYNSLAGDLQEFQPLREGFVGMYVCGPTVYGHSHIGHAKSYVSFDVIVRYLEHLGYRVRYVQNITDVGHLTDDADEGEDKVIRKAREMGLEPMEVAET